MHHHHHCNRPPISPPAQICRSCGVVAEGRIFDEKPRFVDQHFAADNRAPEGIEKAFQKSGITYGDGNKTTMGRGAEAQMKKSAKRLQERLDKVSDISGKLRLVSELVSHGHVVSCQAKPPP